ncbi:MAG TPA: nicotinate phosphoribosyltransferase, partial [Methanomassiliicoccaceae archaeon]|nr:nicotinate phosphoribosyltransferase [Methanomassiliicoccaceae archaeon]
MNPLTDRRFFIATEQDILDGRTTDVYFARTLEILKAKGLMDIRTAAEITVSRLPRDWKWGVYCGLEEVLRLLEGKDIDVWGLPEGTLFPARTQSGIKLPLMTIEGAYSQYCLHETPLLGMLSHSSGVATMAARCRVAAGDLPIFSFGVRRAHPAIAPMVDRSSFIGGCDGVSSILGAEMLGRPANGTMPHALIIMIGDSVEAFKAFDEVMGPEVPRIVLADTFSDEKTEAIAAADAIDLYGVRLDTPGSRRGDFCDIVREVRWELDVRGHKDVKLILSGGLNEVTIPPLVRAGLVAPSGLALPLASVFVVAMGFGIVLPVLPFFLARVLGAGENESIAWHTGLLTAAYMFSLFLFAPFWGRVLPRRRSPGAR